MCVCVSVRVCLCVCVYKHVYGGCTASPARSRALHLCLTNRNQWPPQSADQWECDNHPRQRAMFRLIGCQWQCQWQIRVHIQTATGDVLSCCSCCCRSRCCAAFYHSPYLLVRSTRCPSPTGESTRIGTSSRSCSSICMGCAASCACRAFVATFGDTLGERRCDAAALPDANRCREFI